MSITSYGSVIDSLKHVLSSHGSHDTTKVSLMLHISVQYQNISADSQKKYAEDAYTLAQQLGDAYILSRSLNQMGAVFFNNGKYDSSIYYYQQAIDVCDANGMEDQKVYGYTNIGNVYMRLADYIRAL
ncbi:MAG: tetratricopeptide repeat protein, partial [Chitinophagaceae bacterium]|nr:tetratricopeptide repeat protein [Chitinophagaceae bacterium]